MSFILFVFLQLKTMQLRNLKPYDSTLAALSIGSSKALQLDLAESLLDQISRISYVHPFNAFLAACDTLVGLYFCRLKLNIIFESILIYHPEQKSIFSRISVFNLHS